MTPKMVKALRASYDVPGYVVWVDGLPESVSWDEVLPDWVDCAGTWEDLRETVQPAVIVVVIWSN